MYAVAMPVPIVEEPITVIDVRSDMSRLRRRVQLQGEQIPVNYYGEIIGFLVPVEDARLLHLGVTKSMSLAEFRQSLTQNWESLVSEVDCIFLTFHRREALAFVSPRFQDDLQQLGGQEELSPSADESEDV